MVMRGCGCATGAANAAPKHSTRCTASTVYRTLRRVPSALPALGLIALTFILIGRQPAPAEQNSPACAGRGMMMERGMTGQGMMGAERGSAARHWQAMESGVPEPYQWLWNTLPHNAETLADGAAVYQICASCHGPAGLGDGPAGKGLSPPPANLRDLSRMPMGRSDPYLYWAIAEGGVPFGTAMPAYKDVLSPEQIWAVITYIQAGLPATPGKAPK